MVDVPVHAPTRVCMCWQGEVGKEMYIVSQGDVEVVLDVPVTHPCLCLCLCLC